MKPIQVRVGDFRLGERERAAINEVLDSGQLSEGKKVVEFERKWASFIGTKYSIATSSGAGALITGLAALKYLRRLQNGAKVITSPLTYVATSNAISTVGFQPVYVDVDRQTFAITPENVQALLEQANRPGEYAIVLPVHLMGYPARMDEINQIAEEHALVTFEDSAQAHGTVYNARKTGSLSLLAAFSFYIAHNIQAGEMGAITTDDPEINCLTRRLKAQGRACDCLLCTRSKGWCPLLNAYEGADDFDPRFSHDLIGYNFKLMEFQAALGLAQLEKVAWIIDKRQRNVQYLNDHLAEYMDILQLPAYSDEVSYLAYPLVIKRPDLISRRELRERLERQGIETRPLFGCIPTQQPAYSHLKTSYEGRLPNAEYLGRNAFYIGCHQYLEQDDLDYVIDAFRGVLPTKKMFPNITVPEAAPAASGSPSLKMAMVIPTYNERDNIGRLCEALLALPYEIRIIIIDDNSPDGTGRIADQWAEEHVNIKVIHRAGKGGRGSACIQGFQYALGQDVGYILEMDADFSHDPEEIPRLVNQAAEYGYDMVIASRYAKASRIVDWGIARRVFSKLANFYARAMLGIPISDYTNGYRCYRKDALLGVEFDKIEAKGYVVLSEVAYQLFKKGYIIGEVPTVFVNRKRGQSNLSLSEIANSFLSVLKLKFKYP